MKKTEIEVEVELMEREKKKFEKEIETEKNKFINELKTVGKENIVGNYKPKKLSFFEKIMQIIYGKTK